MSAGDDFWSFSLRVYGEAGVEAACLEVQDRHAVDVNLVLLACWLGTRGIPLSGVRRRTLEEAVRPWRARAILPLRAIRRDLKSPVEHLPVGLPAVREAVLRLRAEVKEAELRAERIEQLMLADLAAGWPEEANGSARLIVDNLMVIHDFRDDQEALRVLVDAVRR